MYRIIQNLKSYGLSEPAIRRLRTAIDRKKKKRTKIFGGTNRGRTVQLKREVKTGDSFQNGIEFSAQPYLINKREVFSYKFMRFFISTNLD